jgi:hypothetical protein
MSAVYRLTNPVANMLANLARERHGCPERGKYPHGSRGWMVYFIPRPLIRSQKNHFANGLLDAKRKRASTDPRDYQVKRLARGSSWMKQYLSDRLYLLRKAPHS